MIRFWITRNKSKSFYHLQKLHSKHNPTSFFLVVIRNFWCIAEFPPLIAIHCITGNMQESTNRTKLLLYITQLGCMYLSLYFLYSAAMKKNSTLAYSGVCIYHVRYVKAKVIWYLLLLIPRMLKMNECKDKPIVFLEINIHVLFDYPQKMLKKCL